MTKGFSLHIGINNINPNHYAGSAGRLKGSENDALEMQSIAKSNGFEDKVLLTKDAIKENIKFFTTDASKKLDAGDFYFISYSGHGGLLPNLNDDPEPSGYDQTWCLYDAQIVDDELKNLWTLFAPGVRILVVTDSCFSGTMLKFYGKPSNQSKILPSAVLQETYLRNKSFYNGILTQPNVPDDKVRASVLLLSSCREDQESHDADAGSFNSKFTEQLLKVWSKGSFIGNYQNFTVEISKRTPITQVPQLKVAGVPNNMFFNGKPFKI
jgi:hypothetical protein